VHYNDFGILRNFSPLMPAIPRYEPIVNSIGKGQSVTPPRKIVNRSYDDVDEMFRDRVRVNGGYIIEAKHKDLDNPRVNGFAYRDETALTPRRKLKVFTIGAGIAGLILAHKMQHQYPEMQDIIEHTIFEALHTVGGTWHLNTYPGVQCDVPAHVYVSPDPSPFT